MPKEANTLDSSPVFFTTMRTSSKTHLLEKLDRIAEAAGLGTLPIKGKTAAIKVHFGEPGNLSYLRPNYAAQIVRRVKEAGGIPFVTDANTLYRGRRDNAVDHLAVAAENGFSFEALGCHVLIADGLKGLDYREIPLGLEQCHCKAPKIASAIAEAEAIFSVNHFKGHDQVGFGGAIKNLGMGSGSRQGKLEMHSDSKPQIDTAKCVGCGQCVAHCAYGAVTLGKNGKAAIDPNLCVGCGQCIANCDYEAAHVVWSYDGQPLAERIAEYALAVVRGKPCLHFNFMVDISPNCDCWPSNDTPITPNLGMAASMDPVALDMACCDLVNEAPVIQESALGHLASRNGGKGADKFSALYGASNWRSGLAYAEKIGLGTRKYRLIEID